MIRLTRLNGRAFILNAELIKFVEDTPDTVVTTRDNDRIVVRESSDDVVARVIEYARSVRGLAAGL